MPKGVKKAQSDAAELADLIAGESPEPYPLETYGELAPPEPVSVLSASDLGSRVDKLEDNVSQILKMVSGIADSLQTKAVEAKVIHTTPVQDGSVILGVSESQSLGILPPIAGLREAPSDFTTIVREVCGKEFGVYVKDKVPGESFLLVIIPPAHVRSAPDDRRVKVITNAQGGAGVREFAQLVIGNIQRERRTAAI